MATHDATREAAVGHTLQDEHLQTPAVVLDLAVVEANCERMLRDVSRLGLAWRAHVKTHKTVELARLQVGEDPGRPINICVSTTDEALAFEDFLEAQKGRGRAINVSCRSKL